MQKRYLEEALRVVSRDLILLGYLSPRGVVMFNRFGLFLTISSTYISEFEQSLPCSIFQVFWPDGYRPRFQTNGTAPIK